MPSVFFRYCEQSSDQPTCILLHGALAEQCIKDPQTYAQQEFNDGTFVDLWEVPKVLENITASGDVGHIFRALVALDKIGENPAVSDFLATIFEAGYRFGARHKS